MTGRLGARRDAQRRYLHVEYSARVHIHGFWREHHDRQRVVERHPVLRPGLFHQLHQYGAAHQPHREPRPVLLLGRPAGPRGPASSSSTRRSVRRRGGCSTCGSSCGSATSGVSAPNVQVMVSVHENSNLVTANYKVLTQLPADPRRGARRSVFRRLAAHPETRAMVGFNVPALDDNALQSVHEFQAVIGR